MTKGGQTCFVYDLRGGRELRIDREPIAATSSDSPRRLLADPDTRHRVYTSLLENPATKLMTRHRDALAARGFPDGLAQYLQYRSHPGKGSWTIARDLRDEFGEAVVLTLPGIYIRQNEGSRPKISLAGRAGLLVPVRDSEGRVVGILNSPDDRAGHSSPKYFWLSSTGPRKGDGPGPGAPVHVAMGSKSPHTIRITEGVIKADLGQALSQVRTLGVAGVGNFTTAVDAAVVLGAKVARVAYDADWRSNPSVARAMVALARGLRSAGIAVEVEVWDEADGKGVDDVLAAGKPTTVMTGAEADTALVQAAKLAKVDPPPPSVESILAKVERLIEAGDFASLIADDDLIDELAKIEGSSTLARVRTMIRGAKKAGFSLSELNNRLQAVRSLTKARLKEAEKNLPVGSRRDAPESPYFDRDSCIYQRTEGVEVRLCNFVARIEEEVVRDDGDEQSRSFLVVGTRCDGLPLSAEVSASKFAEMAWVVEQFGAGAIIEAGSRFREHARAAIQHRSENHKVRTTYAHTGWRQIDGEWAYLHSGGAIRVGGLDPEITVDLGETLRNYELPAPPVGDDRVAAILASLRLLEFGQASRVGSMAVAAAAIAYPYRAAIGPTNHSAQYTGLTGSGKTCMAALSLQHFGLRMNYKDGMPANWDSTANRLEWMLHSVKDALLVIDDFVPGGSTHDVARAHKEVERVFRSQGNGRGRERLGPDGRARPSKPPRGSVISTGEDRVRRKSADARTLPIRFIRDNPAANVLGTVDKEILTKCQTDADAGLYSASMAAFVRWLAPRYESVRDGLSAKAQELRPLATLPGGHARTPDIVADLAAAFDVFLSFALDAGAIDQVRANSCRDAVWDGLMEAAIPAADDDGVSAAEVYIRLLSAAMASHQAYLVDTTSGVAPTMYESACGWRRDPNAAGQAGATWHAPGGSQRIGWTDGKLVYLEPDAAYQVAQRMASSQGESFPVAKATVHAQLDEARKLARKDSRNATEGRNRLTSRESLERRQRSVLVLNGVEFWGDPDPVNPEREGSLY